jgi:hypothetical protein
MERFDPAARPIALMQEDSVFRPPEGRNAGDRNAPNAGLLRKHDRRQSLWSRHRSNPRAAWRSHLEIKANDALVDRDIERPAVLAHTPTCLVKSNRCFHQQDLLVLPKNACAPRIHDKQPTA